MFDKNEIALLDEAIKAAVRVLNRQKNEKPRFAEVAERDVQAYTALSAKIRSMSNEAAFSAKK